MSWFERRREECYDSAVWVPAGKLRNWCVYLGAWLIRPLIKLFFRYEIVNPEALERATADGPVVFACNHLSYADPMVLWCMFYAKGVPSRFLARRTLFKPVVGGFIARVGAIPVDPATADRTAVKRAAAALKRGECLLIFPEGTRMNRPDKVYKPLAGVVLIAQMGKAPILPVGIAGTEKIMPAGKLKVPRPVKVRVAFGEPIDVKGPQFADVEKRQRSQAVLDAVMADVAELRELAERGGLPSNSMCQSPQNMCQESHFVRSPHSMCQESHFVRRASEAMPDEQNAIPDTGEVESQ